MLCLAVLLADDVLVGVVKGGENIIVPRPGKNVHVVYRA